MLVTSINLYQHRKKEETTYSYSLPAEDQQNSGDSQEEDGSEAQDQNRRHLILDISSLNRTKYYLNINQIKERKVGNSSHNIIFSQINCMDLVQ